MKHARHPGLFFTALILSLLSWSTLGADADSHWIATWGTSPFGLQAFGPASEPPVRRQPSAPQPS